MIYQVRSTLEPWEIEMERTDDGVTAFAGMPVVIEAERQG